MKPIKEARGRKLLQWIMAPVAPLVVIGGYFWPYLGFVAISLLTVMLVLVWFRGRYYCGWICAMGGFYERILAKVSLQKPMLPLFKATWFKSLIFVLMMGLLLSRLVMSEGDPEKIGAVFVMMWTVSMGFAISLGLIWKPRSWCSVCPMGTMQGLLAPSTYLIQVADNCKECGLCAKVCPIETNPAAFKGGFVKSADCMRCLNCVENCPQYALSVVPSSSVRASDASREALCRQTPNSCQPGGM